MQRPARPRRRVWDDPRIVFPDDATWSRLSPREREAVVERILAVEREYLETMGEGVRHFRNKAGIGAELEGHFRRAGRGVFVACELPVFYPAEPMIVPDVLAVIDCDPDIEPVTVQAHPHAGFQAAFSGSAPASECRGVYAAYLTRPSADVSPDQRRLGSRPLRAPERLLEPDSWIVSDQKRGVDVVIEVRNLGRKHKDLVENVRDYARLRIPEYFSFDCRIGHLRGWRLGQGAAGYEPIVPQGGYLSSQLLGLELAVVGRRLRFFANASMVPDAGELVARLESMANQQQSALGEAERSREEALAKVSRMQAALARAVLDACKVRGVALSEEQHARIASEADVEVLARWAERAFTVSSAAELFPS